MRRLISQIQDKNRVQAEARSLVEFREDEDRVDRWYLKGTDILHREDGPAYCKGEAEHWFQHGKRHRLDGPALVYDFGPQYWFANGQIANSAKEFKELSGLTFSQVFNLELKYGEICNKTKIEKSDGTVLYFKDGLMHRDDGPAIIYATGAEEWCQYGELHREDGPAMVMRDGYQVWFFKGRYHREGDEPAIYHTDGSLEWWIHGKCHRENGPAFYDADDNTYEWYLNNVEIVSNQQFQQMTGKSDEEMTFLILKYGNIGDGRDGLFFKLGVA